MRIEQLVEIVRYDYLADDPDSSIKKYLWNDNFMLRSFYEAERQACNRSKLIFDDTTSEYTQISLKDGKTTYTLSQKVNWIEDIRFENNAVTLKSKRELERTTPAWRAQTGMKGNPVQAVIRGRTIRFIPSPDASKDSTYIQETEPASGMTTNETWYDSANSLLYRYNGSAWALDSNATLGTVSLEVFRAQDIDLISMSYEPEIPEENHRDLIYWVLHEAYRKQDADTFNQERTDYFLARFIEIFGEYISAEVRTNQLEEDKTLRLRPVAYTSRLTQTSDDDDWDS